MLQVILILANAPDGPEAIFPVNFLTLGVGASMIGNGYLVNTDAFLG